MSDSSGRAVKILQVSDSAGCEIVSENLRLVHEQLKSSGAELVSILSVAGPCRTGKSFLLGLLLRRLRALEARGRAEEQQRERQAGLAEEPPEVALCAAPAPPSEGLLAGLPPWRFEAASAGFLPDWLREGGRERVSEGAVGGPEEGQGFAWRPGEATCTEGIWLWSRPFVFAASSGPPRKIGVLLMDTQGAFDGRLSRAQSSTIFGLTALLSAKLIYNVQNRLDDNLLGQFDYVTTFAQKASGLIESSCAPFGQLHFLVRDWSHYVDGLTPEGCRDKMARHLAEHTAPEKQSNEGSRQMAERLRATFLHPIRCSGLCHPGLHVNDETYSGEIGEVNPNFFKGLDDFINQLLQVDFLRPSAPNGTEITVGTFDRVLIDLADVFRNNADKAISLRDGFVRVALTSSREELQQNFETRLRQLATRTPVLDPDALGAKAEELVKHFEDELRMKMQPFKMKQAEQEKQLESLRGSMRAAAACRVQQSSDELVLANLKMAAPPAVGGAGLLLLCCHPVVLGACASAGLVCHLRRRAAEARGRGAEGVAVDVGQFGELRARDVRILRAAASRPAAGERAGAARGSRPRGPGADRRESSACGDLGRGDERGWPATGGGERGPRQAWGRS